MATNPTVSTDKKAVFHFLTRGVENVYPTREKLGELLLSGKRISSSILALTPLARRCTWAMSSG